MIWDYQQLPGLCKMGSQGSPWSYKKVFRNKDNHVAISTSKAVADRCLMHLAWYLQTWISFPQSYISPWKKREPSPSASPSRRLCHSPGDTLVGIWTSSCFWGKTVNGESGQFSSFGVDNMPLVLCSSSPGGLSHNTVPVNVKGDAGPSPPSIVSIHWVNTCWMSIVSQGWGCWG